MAGDANDKVWPLPKFYFSISIDGKVMPFQEVYGLDTETQIIEYRAGNSKQLSTIKMPGIRKTGNVTLKKGVFAKDNALYDWYKDIKMNLIKRAAVTISLLDESGAPTMVWTLVNAWPTKITGTDLKADGNEVAVETLELAYEGLVIATA